MEAIHLAASHARHPSGPALGPCVAAVLAVIGRSAARGGGVPGFGPAEAGAALPGAAAGQRGSGGAALTAGKVSLVRPLRRGLPAKAGGRRDDTGVLRRRMVRTEPEFDGPRRAAVAPLGRAEDARSATCDHGEATGAVRPELEELRARIAALEAKA